MPLPLPRRSSRLRHPPAPPASPPPPSPPPPRFLSIRPKSATPRSPPPKLALVAVSAPTARTSRALKRRRLSEQSQELHNEYESPRSIKRRKPPGDVHSSRSLRRPKPNPPSAPVADFNSLSLASSDDESVPSPILSTPSPSVDSNVLRSLEPSSSAHDVPQPSPHDFVLGDTMNIDDPYPSPPPVHPEGTPLSVLRQQLSPPAVQPNSYSRFRRRRSPLSSSVIVPSSSPFTNHPSPSPSLPPSHPAYLFPSRARKRRNLYLETNGRVGDVWKYVCIERVETQFSKYGYSNVLAAERQVMGTTISPLERAQFRISTPSTYDDVEMSYDDDEDEEDDCDLDDIEQEILKTIEEELRDEDGMLDVDAEGELDPDHVPVIEVPPITIAPDNLSIDHNPDRFPPFLPQPSTPSLRLPQITLPFPPLGLIRVPSIVNAVSDDVTIGPVEVKLSKGQRSRQTINVKGRDIEEWKPEERGEPMGRGTPVDDRRTSEWYNAPTNTGSAWNTSTLDPSLPSSPSAVEVPVIALDPNTGTASTNDHPQIVAPAGSGTGQDWRAFLDNLARILYMRASSTDVSPSFSPNLPDFPFDISSSLSLPTTLSSLLDPPEFRQLDHIIGGQLAQSSSGPDCLSFGSSLANMTNTVVAARVASSSGYASSSSTLSRALG